MPRKSALFSLLFAGLLGLGAALVARNWAVHRAETQEAQQRAAVPVVVAAAEIPFGAKIAPEQVRVIHWPAEHAPGGVFENPADVAGRIATQKLVPGEAILEARVADGVAGSSLASMIEPRQRAVTVRVNDVIGVAGFLLPGNRVDVLATRLSDERRALTRTLLQNVKVLAVDQTAQIEKDQPVVVRAVTLEMDPRQAELLVQATEEGTVQLALRNPDDFAAVARAPEPAAAPPRSALAPEPRASAPPPPQVEVIRQAQSATQVIP